MVNTMKFLAPFTSEITTTTPQKNMYIYILSDVAKLENLVSITFFGIPFQTAKRVKN